MKQLSTRTISFISLIAIVFLALGVFVIQRVYNTPLPVVENEVEQKENPKTNDETFITDVDMNIDNWQTKETKFFTIKFPKEWYWMESKHGESEGYSEIITNNPNFDINKYPDIGMFTGYDYPMILKENSEVIVTFGGFPTSNSGTPKDSSDYIKKSVLDKNSSAQCKEIQITNNNDRNVTLFITCSFMDIYGYSIKKYSSINNEISITITIGMTKDTIVKQEILDTIAKNIILKNNFPE